MKLRNFEMSQEDLVQEPDLICTREVYKTTWYESSTLSGLLQKVPSRFLDLNVVGTRWYDGNGKHEFIIELENPAGG